MHARVVYLGWEKVSCLERCAQFRSEGIEGFHGNCKLYRYYSTFVFC